MRSYWRILAYIKPYRAQSVFYILVTICAILFGSLTFVLLQPLMDLLFNPGKVYPVTDVPAFQLKMAYIQELMAWVQYKAYLYSKELGQATALLYVVILIAGVNLLGNFFKFLSSYFLGTIRTRVVEDIRQDIFYRLSGQQVAYVEKQRKGDLISRVTSDVTEVEQSVVITFEAIIRDPLNIIWVLALMFMYSWQLTLFIFAVLPVSAAIISRISKLLKRNAVETQDTYGRIMSVVDESISGIRIIKAFYAEKYIRSIFDRFNSRYSSLSRYQWHKKALVPIFSESLMVIVVGVVMWYGGRQVFSGKLQAAEFISYIALFYVISRPAKNLSNAFSNVYKGIASADRMFAVMDAPMTIITKENAIPVKGFNQAITLNAVHFAYGKDEVLKDINLTFEKGKVYALVGPSGGGKSTLAELVLRFYDPTRGQILLDGTDLREMELRDLRGLMAVVTQEPILFNDTIYNNIAFGMEGISRQDVEEAAKAANAHDFIMESPEGYETHIGDRGGLLSGGQRQRLSIARAILKNPPILILDEATSALDTNSEKIVQDALYKLMAHRTSLVIAHRLSTIQDADEIIVIDKGRIAEKGTHTQLLAMRGVYNGLYKMQQLEN